MIFPSMLRLSLEEARALLTIYRWPGDFEDSLNKEKYPEREQPKTPYMGIQISEWIAVMGSKHPITSNCAILPPIRTYYGYGLYQ